jgi:hypothetical protein
MDLNDSKNWHEDEETLASLLHQANNLEQSESQLLLKLDHVRESLADVRVKIAEVKNVNRNVPIYVLPAETLAEVFRAGHRKSSRGRDNMFPVLVSHVSRRFRHIATHQTTLWAYIKVSSSLSAMKWLDVHLARSGACFLDVSISIGDLRNAYNDLDLQYLLEKLTPHFGRLHRLSIDSFHVTHMYSMLSALRDVQVPVLERIEINMRYEEDDDYKHINVFADGAPLLSHVNLRFWSLVALQPPLGAVTTLTLERSWRPMGCGEFRQAIIDMPRLRTLILTADAVSYDGQSHVEIPSLLSLDFRYYQIDSPSIDPSVLVIPALESLTLQRLDESRMSNFVQSLSTNTVFFKYPVLRRLRLHSWTTSFIRDEDVVGLITGLPSVRHLIFRSIPHAILYRLCTDTPDNPFWPMLESVTIKSMGEYVTNMFCLIISRRQFLGRPKLRLKSSFESVPAGRIEWLKEQVSQINYSEESEGSESD